jgi:2-C-methyl-D-erythritol 2,4-cyclodiphosphate synthase/2-C-methyl-D-erythritol 4-phosphate cytidylyltransferase
VKEDEYNDFIHLQTEKVKLIIGGNTRFNSVLNGIKQSNLKTVIIHDAARPNITEEDILKVYEMSKKYDAVSLGVKVKDCIRCVNEKSNTLERNHLWRVQTPQALNRELLLEGLESNKFENYYDDCEVLEKNFNIDCFMVEGSYKNIKATTIEDIEYLEFLLGQKDYKIGQSKDTHKLVENRKLILGGVEIPFELGLLGHSDADVVYHCVVESIIGALGLGDIGKLYPDNDVKYKDISSSFFMKDIYKIMDGMGYEIGNIDVTIYIEKPILKDYKPIMEENISNLLHTNIENVNVKATRGEGIGFIGRGEGVSAEAVCLLKKKK